MRALLIVDVQVDFCPGGMLPAADGNRVVSAINELMEKFDCVIASRDWHPKETKHFEKWPVHCIQNSRGAAFHPQLNSERIQQEFLKGTEGKDDGYSAFEATNVKLSDYLKDKNIADVYVCGIATEFCVKATTLDSIKQGFSTYVVEDAIAGVKLKANDEQEAKDEMKKAGARFIERSEIAEPPER